MTKNQLLTVAKPILFNSDMVRAILEGRKTVTRRCVKRRDTEDCEFSPDAIKTALKPAYSPGDILYVRETWSEPYAEKDYAYAADYDEHDIVENRHSSVSVSKNMLRWRPSIHMPKNAARIFLRVTDVRVEHLHDIMDDPPGPDNQVVREGCRYGCDFIALWENTIKKEVRAIYGWYANPLVFVYEFERVVPDA